MKEINKETAQQLLLQIQSLGSLPPEQRQAIVRELMSLFHIETEEELLKSLSIIEELLVGITEIPIGAETLSPIELEELVDTLERNKKLDVALREQTANIVQNYIADRQNEVDQARRYQKKQRGEPQNVSEKTVVAEKPAKEIPASSEKFFIITNTIPTAPKTVAELNERVQTELTQRNLRGVDPAKSVAQQLLGYDLAEVSIPVENSIAINTQGEISTPQNVFVPAEPVSPTTLLHAGYFNMKSKDDDTKNEGKKQILSSYGLAQAEQAIARSSYVLSKKEKQAIKDVYTQNDDPFYLTLNAQNSSFKVQQVLSQNVQGDYELNLGLLPHERGLRGLFFKGTNMLFGRSRNEIVKSAVVKGLKKIAGKKASEVVIGAAAKAGLAEIGAGAGTAIAPGVGTVIGAVVGLAADLLSWVSRKIKEGDVDWKKIAAFGIVGLGLVGASPALVIGGGAYLVSPVLGLIAGLFFKSIARPVVWSIVFTILFVAFTMFIINSGAYLVPSVSQNFSNFDGELPPDAEECFVLNETEGPYLPNIKDGPVTSLGWENYPEKRTRLKSTIAYLAQSQRWINFVCAGGPVTVTHAAQVGSFGGWAPSATGHDIILYSKEGLGHSDYSTIYTFAHESGHIASYHNEIVNQKYDELAAPDGIFLYSYNAQDKSRKEDMAETFGVYPIYAYRKESAWFGILDDPAYTGHKAYGEFVYGITF